MAEIGGFMRVYLDNVIASALVRGDLAEPSEMDALRSLQAQACLGKLEFVTSRESWREQERTKSPEPRAELRNARSDVDVVSHDHRVLGFNTIDYGHRGFIASPLVTDIVDEALFTTLRNLGLKDADARHLMYAVSNGCVRFFTTDRDFVDRREAIQAACPGIGTLGRQFESLLTPPRIRTSDDGNHRSRD